MKHVDVNIHKENFDKKMSLVLLELCKRKENHDESKNDKIEIGLYSDDKDKRDTALIHHYIYNDHHPEHYLDGIDGMNLVTLLEMVCDWASYSDTNEEILSKFDKLCLKHKIDVQLRQILLNTLKLLYKR